MLIALTGSTGKLGRVASQILTDAGHEVLELDITGVRRPGFVQVDLTDYGQVNDALAGVGDVRAGVDAVVHLAAIPAPGIRTDVATFHNNIAATFNVFWAAVRLGIRRIVYASSETLLGLPFDVPPPYIPVDEDYPARPESVYSLVKHLEETMAAELVRWHPETSITALRFSNVMVPGDYDVFEAFDEDPHDRKWNLWGYIDARDASQAILLALEKAPPGFDRFIIAAADTVMTRADDDLVAEVFPGVPYRSPAGDRDTLLSIEKARRVLGYAPEHSWRDPR